MLKQFKSFIKERLPYRVVKTPIFINSKLEQLFLRMSGRRIMHILHIGKTGGMALKETLKNNLETPEYKIKLHNHNFVLKDIPKGEKFVFFVRNPIDRFISGFYSRKRKGRPRFNIPWSPDEKIAFRIFNTPNELALGLSSKDREIREAAINAMRSISHVKTSYWYWFIDEDYLLSRLPDILFIGFQENLEKDFESLKKILQIDEAVKLTKDEVKAHKNPTHYDRHLDDEAKKNLIVWYERDFKFFELSKKITSQINPRL